MVISIIPVIKVSASEPSSVIIINAHDAIGYTFLVSNYSIGIVLINGTKQDYIPLCHLSINSTVEHDRNISRYLPHFHLSLQPFLCLYNGNYILYYDTFISSALPFFQYSYPNTVEKFLHELKVVYEEGRGVSGTINVSELDEFPLVHAVVLKGGHICENYIISPRSFTFLSNSTNLFMYNLPVYAWKDLIIEFNLITDNSSIKCNIINQFNSVNFNPYLKVYGIGINVFNVTSDQINDYNISLSPPSTLISLAGLGEPILDLGEQTAENNQTVFSWLGFEKGLLYLKEQVGEETRVLIFNVVKENLTKIYTFYNKTVCFLDNGLVAYNSSWIQWSYMNETVTENLNLTPIFKHNPLPGLPFFIGNDLYNVIFYNHQLYISFLTFVGHITFDEPICLESSSSAYNPSSSYLPAGRQNGSIILPLPPICIYQLRGSSNNYIYDQANLTSSALSSYKFFVDGKVHEGIIVDNEEPLILNSDGVFTFERPLVRASFTRVYINQDLNVLILCDKGNYTVVDLQDMRVFKASMPPLGFSGDYAIFLYNDSLCMRPLSLLNTSIRSLESDSSNSGFNFETFYPVIFLSTLIPALVVVFMFRKIMKQVRP
ncbi:hypothetical protein [Sulfuracidifex tepidarius]|uniref:Uncharacterized protein n=1 Tax=Sulfuracidifex tepidarius TaxID=1294262 RepID=A0A510E535_9CREN|nr:hypothetical protein [Sulfuracidifex tepidarius]BBG24837.1 hypothetical protein IC006_2171 [Sulfuracidifex tepidarius]BBG27621.1 hypothetical protein IC007_2175 [Sulfuracidifex tepidarius]